MQPHPVGNFFFGGRQNLCKFGRNLGKIWANLANLGGIWAKVITVRFEQI